MREPKCIGKFAFITDPDSIYYREWGEIMDFDGDVYHIAIAQDSKSTVVFDRDQFRVPRKQWMRFHTEKIKNEDIIVT